MVIFDPAGAPAERPMLNLSPFVQGELIINRNVVFGEIVAVATNPGGAAIWFTLTRKDTWVELLVGWPLFKVKVMTAVPNELVTGVNDKVPVLAGLV